MNESTGDIVGRHLVADLDGIEPAKLCDLPTCLEILTSALGDTGHTILERSAHEFPGGGFTLLYLLAESHLSVHTYPERGYLAFDLFSCGEHDPRVVLDRLAAALKPTARRDRMLMRYGSP